MKAEKQIARNYSQALFEIAANDFESFLEEIKALNIAINQVQGARKAFETPSITKDDKKELIRKLLQSKCNEKLLNFLFLLIDKQRFNLLPEIQDEFNKLVNKAKNVVVAKVSSASEMDPNTLEKLKQKLEAILGKNEKVTIESKIEPQLIGGMVVKVNDLIYDGSVKGRIENLKRRLVT